MRECIPSLHHILAHWSTAPTCWFWRNAAMAWERLKAGSAFCRRTSSEIEWGNTFLVKWCCKPLVLDRFRLCSESTPAWLVGSIASITTQSSSLSSPYCRSDETSNNGEVGVMLPGDWAEEWIGGVDVGRGTWRNDGGGSRGEDVACAAFSWTVEPEREARVKWLCSGWDISLRDVLGCTLSPVRGCGVVICSPEN